MEPAWYYVVGPTSVEEVRDAFDKVFLNGVSIVEEQGIFWVFVDMGMKVDLKEEFKNGWNVTSSNIAP